jgi:hypothetical protein
VKSIFAAVFIGSALVLGMMSCAPAPAAVIPATPEPATTEVPETGGQIVEVTSQVFFDYDGNGIKTGVEPALADIEVTFQPGDYRCVTDKKGSGSMKIPAGNYTVSVNDPAHQFKFILNSQSSFSSIKGGFKISIRKSQEVPIPLAEGFLTWPFKSNAAINGIIYYFQPEDPTIDPLTTCEEGT